MKHKYVLGISAFYHDSAACLLRDGEVIAAAQEERFTRKKHDYHFPRQSIEFCLDYAGININEVGYIAFYERSSLKFDRIIKTYLTYAPRGVKSFLKAMPLWCSERFWIEREIRKNLGFSGQLICPEHHQSHGASAFFPSPFESAAFLTMDGVGEWATLSYGVGESNRTDIHGEIRFPHSLGLLYSAFTFYAGFKVNSGEYKLMGLAPYGRPIYVDKIYNHLIDVREDGSFRLNMEYFDYCTGFTMTNSRFHSLFGREPRKPEAAISQFDMDIASSIQQVTEEIVLKIGRHVHKVTGQKNLCMAGGVALNCVANGKLLGSGPFEKIWIQPAAGDAGASLGAAFHVWYNILHEQRHGVGRGKDRQKGSYLGTEYSDELIEQYLNKVGARYTKIKEGDLSAAVAKIIAEENVVGWFNGRMEFGPRALGARSILGDPRSPQMQSKINQKIKFREGFRPFAPSVMCEKTKEWFEIGDKLEDDEFSSPYMLVVGSVKSDKCINKEIMNDDAIGFEKLKIPRSLIPAVTHVDYSARIQTVHEDTNPRFSNLLRAFNSITGCPVVVNTSFNVRGEPIVESPDDAYRCFMRTEMDYLVLGSYLLKKEDQPKYVEAIDWKTQFELD